MTCLILLLCCSTHWIKQLVFKHNQLLTPSVTPTHAAHPSALFLAGVHAADLKPALSKALNSILEPVRRHFVENKEAAALLKQVRSYKVTR